MLEVLCRAGCFAAIIIFGCVMKKIGFFEESDFDLISKIMLKVTLPGAIVVSFSGTSLSPKMLLIILLGFGCGVLYMGVAVLMNLKSTRKKRAFELMNLTGYNIGSFTLPFAQSFLGPTGVVIGSLFDSGNALVCLGGSYSIASMIQDGGRFSIKKILEKMVRSVPFVTYLIMTVLSLLRITLPETVLTLAGIVGNANPFMAMLMLGVGLKLAGGKSGRGTIIRILTVRYAIAVGLALIFYFVLPLPLEYRQALTVLVFSPISAASVPFIAELKNDSGLASTINSLSIVISVVCMVAILTVML